ncbi:MAG: FAD synthetase family protein [Spirochaetes bacterium]|nr:FAD synthetase family protein [Spirochaetota bacterium]
MTVLTWADFAERRARLDRPVDLTIGAFDGLHLGHRSLIAAITAGLPEILPLVITFSRNPALVLGRGEFPGLILSHQQKLERLAGLGVGAVAVVDFSEELSKLSGRVFIGLLRENLVIRTIVVGYDFRFGRDRDTDAGGLAQMLRGSGTEVRVTGPVLHRGGAVSSSRIRKSIQEASFAEAREMLSADHSLDLRDLPVARQGGMSLIPRKAMSQVVPRAGIYAVTCTRGASDARYRGELTIGEGSLALTCAEGAEGADITFAIFEQ